MEPKFIDVTDYFSSLITKNSLIATSASYTPSVTSISNPLEINGPITHNSARSTGQTYLHEVAVIAVTRAPEGYIVKSKMVKTMWVETKDGGSIDFAASKDPEVGKFEPEDIIIKTLRTIKL